MRVLIIYAHPSEASFTQQVLRHLRKGLLAAGHVVEVSDLYKIGFRSDMTEAEYHREGFSNSTLPISADVKTEHLKLNKADCVCFLYPVWWSDCPAKLKGWFDRVYTIGYAYSKTTTPRTMSQIKKGLVLCAAGHTNEVLEETGVAQSMRRIMLDDRLGDRFLEKQMIILGGTLAGKARKEELLKQVYSVGQNLEMFFTKTK